MFDLRCFTWGPVQQVVRTPSSPLVEDVVLVAGDTTKIQLVTGMSLVRDGGSGSSTFVFELHAPGVPSPKIRVADAILGPGPQSYSWDNMTDKPFIIVPPGWVLVATFPATAAGETLRCRFTVAASQILSA